MTLLLRHRVLVTLGIAVAVLGMSVLSVRPAIACGEKCAHIFDPETGEEVGHACLTGSQGINCEATVADCDIDPCPSFAAIGESGVPLLVVESCSSPTGTVEMTAIDWVDVPSSPLGRGAEAAPQAPRN